MDKIKVSKERLLETLKANREKHKAEFEEAVAKHREEAVSLLRKRADDIEDGEKVDISFDLPKPVQYLASFDEAIEMLEWSQDKTLELDQQDFRRYVMNKWEWEHQFLANTSLYSNRA